MINRSITINWRRVKRRTLFIVAHTSLGLSMLFTLLITALGYLGCLFVGNYRMIDRSFPGTARSRTVKEDHTFTGLFSLEGMIALGSQRQKSVYFLGADEEQAKQAPKFQTKEGFGWWTMRGHPIMASQPDLLRGDPLDTEWGSDRPRYGDRVGVCFIPSLVILFVLAGLWGGLFWVQVRTAKPNPAN